MGFLTPLALLFASLALPILVLYMLKLRRRDVSVSSTLLWRRLLRDREANAPWQRLRRNWLLILQLLLLILLTLALARPFRSVPAVVSGSAVILLDASASMRAQDVAPNRFAVAQERVNELLARRRVGQRMTVILVGPQPVALGSSADDPSLVRRALREATPTQGAADWEAAFALAAGALTGIAEPEVVVVSDGGLPAGLPSLPGAVHFVPVGRGGENVAITALATRQGGVGPQAFVRVSNFGAQPVDVRVEFTVDGALFDARRLTVPAQGEGHLTLTELPPDLRALEARLAVEDALPLDDVAWAVHTPPASGRVLLVTSGNLFLERALRALPGREVVRLAPDQPLPTEPYDLYVYDGPVDHPLPAGNVWLIGPRETVEDGWRVEVGDVFSATTPTGFATDDPLLRYVDWEDVRVLRARAVAPPPAARILIEAAGGPLLLVAERPEGRLAVLTFDLHDSDLPLHVAFPILTANVVDWLMPSAPARLPTRVKPGEPVPIALDVQAAEDTWVVDPAGARHRVARTAGSPSFAATERLGLYHVENAAGERLASFAVNLFDAGESDIAPRETIEVGRVEVRPTSGDRTARQGLWPWFAGGALTVLALEWWVYHRGGV
jgi:hypothetical protein